VSKKFVASFSGGKDSALAIYRAILASHELVGLITTYDSDTGVSWSHGMSKALLECISASIGVPAWAIETTSAEYAKNFEDALAHAKELGAEVCVFGDTDIEGHQHWGEQRCQAVGLGALFPLWKENRRDLVYEIIDSGFVATITTIDTKQLDDRFLGKQLTREIADQIAAEGADICGENGEYHTLASDGPIFKHPIKFELGEKMMRDYYAILPVQ